MDKLDEESMDVSDSMYTDHDHRLSSGVLTQRFAFGLGVFSFLVIVHVFMVQKGCESMYTLFVRRDL